MANVYVSGSFDDIRSAEIRFLDEASRFGPVTVGLWSDSAVRQINPAGPKFPAAERRYFLESLRYVAKVVLVEDETDRPTPDPTWIRVQRERDASPAFRAACAAHGVTCHVIPEADLRRFPAPAACPDNPHAAGKKVVVTGCFDWFHTGHVRFFEEVSEIGDLYAVVGHDANISLLKGAGHPLFPEAERCYVANAVKFARLALVSSGNGWLDAEPEIARLRPDVYAVNEDGDRPEKRQFCAERGIEYRVLKRLPKPGLERRASTALRGF